MEVSGKNVLVFGSGISGVGAVKLLNKYGAKVVLYDGNEKLDKEEVRKKLSGDFGTEIVIGEFPKELFDRVEIAVLSPGVPTDLPVVKEMQAHGILVTGEVELAYEFGRGDVLAITGTNGKTTTTTLLGEIMKANQEAVCVVGNIGKPYTGEVLHTTPESVTVAEISSFQLETINAFRPFVSAILNITPDHLNRHHSMENYVAVKESVTKNQTKEDTCVLNYEDKYLREFAKECPAKVVFFSSGRKWRRHLIMTAKYIWKKKEKYPHPPMAMAAGLSLWKKAVWGIRCAGWAWSG